MQTVVHRRQARTLPADASPPPKKGDKSAIKDAPPRQSKARQSSVDLSPALGKGDNSSEIEGIPPLRRRTRLSSLSADDVASPIRRQLKQGVDKARQDSEEDDKSLEQSKSKYENGRSPSLADFEAIDSTHEQLKRIQQAKNVDCDASPKDQASKGKAKRSATKKKKSPAIFSALANTAPCMF